MRRNHPGRNSDSVGGFDPLALGGKMGIVPLIALTKMHYWTEAELQGGRKSGPVGGHDEVLLR